MSGLTSPTPDPDVRGWSYDDKNERRQRAGKASEESQLGDLPQW